MMTEYKDEDFCPTCGYRWCENVGGDEQCPGYNPNEQAPNEDAGERRIEIRGHQLLDTDQHGKRYSTCSRCGGVFSHTEDIADDIEFCDGSTEDMTRKLEALVLEKHDEIYSERSADSRTVTERLAAVATRVVNETTRLSEPPIHDGTVMVLVPEVQWKKLRDVVDDLVDGVGYRCKATDTVPTIPDGEPWTVRCDLPSGHSGQHRSDEACMYWGDPAQPATGDS